MVNAALLFPIRGYWGDRPARTWRGDSTAIRTKLWKTEFLTLLSDLPSTVRASIGALGQVPTIPGRLGSGTRGFADRNARHVKDWRGYGDGT